MGEVHRTSAGVSLPVHVMGEDVSLSIGFVGLSFGFASEVAPDSLAVVAGHMGALVVLHASDSTTGAAPLVAVFYSLLPGFLEVLEFIASEVGFKAAFVLHFFVLSLG